ncbi:MAG: alpha-1,2-fucosyltransferase [Methylotenera sp.]
MIISNLIGGLGNQMFQYAAGRSISLKLGTTLRLDISGFSNYGLHQGFELQRIFNCKAEIANEIDVRRILGLQFFPIIRRIFLRPSMTVFRGKKNVVEPHFHYWPGINYISDDCFLSGYWQSEKYFSDVATQIRNDFIFKLPMASENAELAKQINQVNAVSLHVRRGDYVNNPKNIAMYGLCSLEYYQAAIRHIAEQVERPHFFVFSDDIDWVQKNLKIDFPHQCVNHNHGAESYNDMRLMSLCKHHIIANSSFSWWGAWLNPSADKIVVTPKRWFANETNTQDLIPLSWVKL